MATTMQGIANAIGSGLQNFASHSARAAAQANGVSAAAQAAQGAFNQASADQANMLNQNAMQSQYGFNSSMMQAANEYNTSMWNQAAQWNETMWEKQAAFNAEQAQIQRDWSERMENTKYQRAIKDMSAAGLNPILAVTGGGLATGAGSATAASVGGAQMSSAQSQMASGGLLGANTASEGNYTGQMEYMAGMLGLLSSALGGIATAQSAMGGLGEFGEGMANAFASLLNPETKTGSFLNKIKNAAEKGRSYSKDPSYTPNYRNGIDWNMKNPNW